MAEVDVLRSLLGKLSSELLSVNLNTLYYDGQQPLSYMVPALEDQFGDRLTQLVINWPRLGADIHEERLDIEGFRYGRSSEPDDELWDWWKSQDGPVQSQQANLESLICGRAYAFVGAGDDDTPVLSVEHPSQAIHSVDPKTRRVSAIVKRWDDDENVQWAELLLPDSNVVFRNNGQGGWVEDSRTDHNLGHVLGVPIVNRGRMLKPFGISEFHDIIPVANAANKMATDMMISGEFHAMPRRWVFGMSADEFVDENGRPLSPWEQVAGRVWSTELKPGDVEAGQFPESDLQVFHNTIKLLAQLAAQLLALPPDFMSFGTVNPPSAESIRSSEARLIKRAERQQVVRSAAYEQVARLFRLVQRGSLTQDDWLLETIWRDPATPTRAQAADAAVKLFKAGIVPLEQVWQDLGYSVIQRERMRNQMEEQARTQLQGLSDLGFGVKPVTEMERADA